MAYTLILDAQEIEDDLSRVDRQPGAAGIRHYYDASAIAEPVSVAMDTQVEQGYDGLGLKDYEAAGVQNPSSVKARIIANARRKNEQSGDRRKVGFNDRWDEAERLRAIERFDRGEIGSPSQMSSIVSETGDRYMSGRVRAKPRGSGPMAEKETYRPGDQCPRCASPAPHLHPALQCEGEVQTCGHAFHDTPTNQNRALAPLGDAPRGELEGRYLEVSHHQINARQSPSAAGFWWHCLELFRERVPSRRGILGENVVIVWRSDYEALQAALRAAAGVGGAPDSYQEKQDALRLILPSIPQGTDWHANRYDTDNSMVLILWRARGTNGEGETLQYDCAKALPAGVGGAPEEKP